MEKQPQISREHYQKMKDEHKMQEDAFIDTAHVEALKENEARESNLKKEFTLEVKLPIETIEIGNKSGAELITELTKAGVTMSDYVLHLLKDEKIFPSQIRNEQVDLVMVEVGQLGFEPFETILLNDLINKGKEFGLEPCPIDTALYWILSHGNKAGISNVTFISNKLYSDPSDEWTVFSVSEDDDNDLERNLAAETYDWKDSVHRNMPVCFRVSNK